MILTCPSCAAQFNVNPNALGETGRTVRCGKCKNQWHASRPLITLPADDLKFAGAGVSSSSEVSQEPSPVSAPVSGVTQNTISSSSHFKDMAQDEPSLPSFNTEVPPTAKRNAIIAAIVLAGLLSMPVFMMNHGGGEPHPDAVKAPLEKNSEKTTEEAKPVEKKEDKEIILDGTPTTLLKEEQGRTILSIEGALINKTTKTLTVPILQAQALNAKGKVVKEWIIPIVTKEMDPGMRQSFSYSMPFSEQGVVDIAFHFI